MWHVMEVAVHSGAAAEVSRGRSMLALRRLVLLRGIKMLRFDSLVHRIRFLRLLGIRDLIFSACKRARQTRCKHCSLIVSIGCAHAGGYHVNRTLAAASCCLALLLCLAVVALVLLVLVKGSFWAVRFSACANKPSIYLVCRSTDSFLGLAAVGGYLETPTDSTILVRIGAAFTATIVSGVLHRVLLLQPAVRSHLIGGGVNLLILICASTEPAKLTCILMLKTGKLFLEDCVLAWIDKHVFRLHLCFRNLRCTVRVNAMLHTLIYTAMLMVASRSNWLTDRGSLLVLFIVVFGSVLLRHHGRRHGVHVRPEVRWSFVPVHDRLRLLHSLLLVRHCCSRCCVVRLLLLLKYTLIDRRGGCWCNLLLLHHLLLMNSTLLLDLLDHISDLICLVWDKWLMHMRFIRHRRHALVSWALTAAAAKRLHPKNPLPRQLFALDTLLLKSLLFLLLFLLQYMLLLGGSAWSSTSHRHLLLKQELANELLIFLLRISE